jgi:hypothetical protein
MPFRYPVHGTSFMANRTPRTGDAHATHTHPAAGRRQPGGRPDQPKRSIRMRSTG